jgi:uncharacterized protein YabE (DUF348 family)
MQKIDKVNKINLSARVFVLLVAVFISLAASVFNIIATETKEVIIKDENSIISVKTFKSTVGEILREQNIHIGDYDEVQPAQDEKLTEGMEVIINRAVPVSIMADHNEMSIHTAAETVQDVLEQNNIILNEKDSVNYSLTDEVFANMAIKVTRVTESVITVTDKIPFKTIKRPNNSMEKGQDKIVQEGSDGVSEKQYAVIMHDGEEVSRQLIGEKVLTEPKERVHEYGTIAVAKTSRGETFRYKKVLDMTATAYDLSYESCGKLPGDKYYGIAATGMKIRRGVVAVDPRVIPYYSRLYIEAPDGSWIYGYAVAGDTGGAIKGNKIDLFMDSATEVKNFGRRKAKVYILE